MTACKLVGKLFPTMKTIGGSEGPKKADRQGENETAVTAGEIFPR